MIRIRYAYFIAVGCSSGGLTISIYVIVGPVILYIMVYCIVYSPL